jgi:hypothetical protein
MPQPYAGAVTGSLLFDADQDGHLDLVLTTTSAAEGLGVLLGDGSGRLAPPTWYAPTTDTQRAIAGDFNEDGDPDVVLYEGVLQLSLGGPGASFAPPVLIDSNLERSADVGDVNGDGHADLVVADTSELAVFLGDGAGAFSLQPTKAITWTSSLALGHFNGDAALDLVVGHPELKLVSLWINGGAGAFNIVQTFPLGEEPQWLSRGDFNGDGLDDVAVLTSSGKVMLLRQGGGGYFTLGPVKSIATSCTSGQIAFDDLTGDGRGDLVVACAGTSTALHLLISAGVSFQEDVELPKDGAWNRQSLGDLDGDGWLDIVYDSGDRLAAQLLNH